MTTDYIRITAQEGKKYDGRAPLFISQLGKPISSNNHKNTVISPSRLNYSGIIYWITSKTLHKVKRFPVSKV